MNPIKIYHQNTRGLNTKIRKELRAKTILFNYDIYALTETWIQDNINSCEIFDENYIEHRHDCKLNNELSTVHLPVLIAIKLSAIRLEKWENIIPFENIWLKINKNGGKNLYINFVYLRSGFVTEHLNIYLNHLSEIVLSKDPNAKFLIMGDFNLSCISWIK